MTTPAFLSAGNLNPTLVTVSELTVGDTIIEDFNVSDEDSSQTHFWTLSGDDAQYFEVDPTSGELTLLSPLDFEDPEDGNADNLYNLVLSVTDSHGSPLTSNPYSFQVLISAENEPPYLTGSYSPPFRLRRITLAICFSRQVAVDPESGTSKSMVVMGFINEPKSHSTYYFKHRILFIDCIIRWEPHHTFYRQ